MKNSEAPLGNVLRGWGGEIFVTVFQTFHTFSQQTSFSFRTFKMDYDFEYLKSLPLPANSWDEEDMQPEQKVVTFPSQFFLFCFFVVSWV